MAECGKSTIVNLPWIHAGCADYANVCACPVLYSNFDKNRYRFGVRTDRRAQHFRPHFRDPLGIFLPLVWPRRRRFTELLTHGSLRAAVNCTREYAQSGPHAHRIDGHRRARAGRASWAAGQTDLFRRLLLCDKYAGWPRVWMFCSHVDIP